MKIPPPPADPKDLKTNTEGAIPPPPSDPSQLKEKEDTITHQVLGWLKDNGLSVAAATAVQGEGAEIGAGIGTAVAGPAGIIPGAIVGAGAAAALGGGAGQLATENIKNIKRVISGEAPTPPSEVARKSAGSALVQGLGGAAGQTLVLSAPTIASFAGKIVKGAGSLMAQKLGGIAPESVEMLEKNAPAVIKYARMGAEAAQEAASNAAKKFQGAWDSFHEVVSNEYAQLIESSVKNKFGPKHTIDLASPIEKVNVEVMDTVGYGDPERIVDKSGENIYKRFSEQAKKLKKATPRQVYNFQKDLNAEIRDARARSDYRLPLALNKIKKATVDTLEKTIPEVLEANTIYKSAEELGEELRKVINADDAFKVINSHLRSKSHTGDAIMKLVSQNPKAKETLEEMATAMAGKSFSQWSRFLPNNQLPKNPLWGLAYYGAAEAIQHLSGSTPEVLGAGIATSPRLYGEAGNLALKAGSLAAEKIAENPELAKNVLRSGIGSMAPAAGDGWRSLVSKHADNP